MPSLSAPHLDTALLATLRELMEADFPVLLDTFLSDAGERLLILWRTCAAGQAEELRRTAHSFKGSCCNVGAVALGALCEQLEDLALQGNLTEAPALIERIEREFAIVRILCKRERPRLPDSC